MALTRVLHKAQSIGVTANEAVVTCTCAVGTVHSVGQTGCGYVPVLRLLETSTAACRLQEQEVTSSFCAGWIAESAVGFSWDPLPHSQVPCLSSWHHLMASPCVQVSPADTIHVGSRMPNSPFEEPDSSPVCIYGAVRGTPWRMVTLPPRDCVRSL